MPLSAEPEPKSDDMCLWSDKLSDELHMKFQLNSLMENMKMGTSHPSAT